jgi:hypothetical protein
MDIEGQEYGFLNEEGLNILRNFEYIILESHFVSEELNSKKIDRFLKENKLDYFKKDRFYYIDPQR